MDFLFGGIPEKIMKKSCLLVYVPVFWWQNLPSLLDASRHQTSSRLVSSSSGIYSLVAQDIKPRKPPPARQNDHNILLGDLLGMKSYPVMWGLQYIIVRILIKQPVRSKARGSDDDG